MTRDNNFVTNVLGRLQYGVDKDSMTTLEEIDDVRQVRVCMYNAEKQEGHERYSHRVICREDNPCSRT